MQEMFSKLSSYAALLGVIGAIGGGFMAWVSSIIVSHS